MSSSRAILAPDSSSALFPAENLSTVRISGIRFGMVITVSIKPDVKGWEEEVGEKVGKIYAHTAALFALFEAGIEPGPFFAIPIDLESEPPLIMPPKSTEVLEVVMSEIQPGMNIRLYDGPKQAAAHKCRCKQRSWLICELNV